MSRLCGECGERAVEPTAKAGRTSPFRQFVALPIPADFAIPTCLRCGAEWFDRATSERLDRVLTDVAAERLAHLAVEALGHLSSFIHQRDLETLLGLSAGYLSKVRHRRERPSSQLVAALALLAARPRRINEIGKVWETGELPVRIADDSLVRVDATLDPGSSVLAL